MKKRIINYFATLLILLVTVVGIFSFTTNFTPVSEEGDNFVVQNTNIQSTGEEPSVEWVGSPILPLSFHAIDGTVTNTSFDFYISAVNGSEEMTNAAGQVWFDTETSFLSSDLVEIDTEFVEKTDSIVEVDGTEYAKYKFSAINLEAGTTYSNLAFHYQGTSEVYTSFEDVAVTTNEFISPFNPIENPIEFDYSSTTSESFEFTIVVRDTSSNDYSSFAPNETVLFANNRQLNTTLKHSEEVADEPYIRYTYEVIGLNPSTEYKDFAIVINAYNGSTEHPDSPFASRSVNEYYTNIYEIPYVTIFTLSDYSLAMLKAKIYGIIIILIIIIVVLYILYVLWKRNITIGIYGDIYSVDLNTPVFNIVNGRKHREFWKTPMDHLRLYVAGNEVQATFIKERDEKGKETGVIKAALIDVIDNGKNVFFIMSGMQHNDFEISWDGGQTAYGINSLHSKKLDKQLAYLKEKKEAGEMAKSIFLLEDSKATPTTLRYTIISPRGNKLEQLISQIGDKLLFYYQVDDKMYPLQTKYIGQSGVSYSWDIIGLKPGTAYVNLNWSLDGEKLMASSVAFGVTPDESGNKVSLKDAVLAEKPEGVEGKELPSLNVNVAYLGREVILRQNTIAAQKHHQRDAGYWLDEKLLSQKAKQYLYEWYDDIDVLLYEIEDEDVQEIISEDDKKIIETFNKTDVNGHGSFDQHLINLVDEQIEHIEKNTNKKTSTPKKTTTSKTNESKNITAKKDGGK